MLQHSEDYNVRHKSTIDEATGQPLVVVSARRNLVAGEELLNSYDSGELTPAKFLTRFGFVPGGEVGEFIATIKEKDKGRLPFGFRIDDRKNW